MRKALGWGLIEGIVFEFGETLGMEVFEGFGSGLLELEFFGSNQIIVPIFVPILIVTKMIVIINPVCQKYTFF